VTGTRLVGRPGIRFLGGDEVQGGALAIIFCFRWMSEVPSAEARCGSIGSGWFWSAPANGGGDQRHPSAIMALARPLH
jgi:hypothetical protein